MIPMPVIIQAMEYVESGNNPNVVSKGGCIGLLQICPQWSKYSKKELLIPEINRKEGERFLAYWMRKSGGNLTKALAAYNCGYGGLQKKCGTAYAIKVINRAIKIDKSLKASDT